MKRTSKKETPYCFGKLETVFPLGEGGLRHTPESCFPCIYKTECLRAALNKSDGVKVREEKLQRAYEAGALGFFERWSRKKALHIRKQKLKKG
jgi:hypothetical protein